MKQKSLTSIYESNTFKGHDNIKVINSEYAHRMQYEVYSLAQDRDKWEQLADDMYRLAKSEQIGQALDLYEQVKVDEYKTFIQVGGVL